MIKQNDNECLNNVKGVRTTGLWLLKYWVKVLSVMCFRSPDGKNPAVFITGKQLPRFSPGLIIFRK